MSWNYRLCKRVYSAGTQDQEYGYTIHEVYYNSDGSIWAVSEDPVDPYGETLEEVNSVLERMKQACQKEVIDLDTLVLSNHI